MLLSSICLDEWLKIYEDFCSCVCIQSSFDNQGTWEYHYCYGVLSRKASHELQQFLICCASPFKLESFLILPPVLSGNYQQRHLAVSKKNLTTEMAVNFAYGVSPFILLRFLTHHKISRHGADGFMSPPKEVVLLIFTSLKVHHPRLGFNPWIFGLMVSTLTTRTPRAIKGPLEKSIILHVIWEMSTDSLYLAHTLCTMSKYADLESRKRRY
jgi:hypothetical protein